MINVFIYIIGEIFLLHLLIISETIHNFWPPEQEMQNKASDMVLQVDKLLLTPLVPFNLNLEGSDHKGVESNCLVCFKSAPEKGWNLPE